jgi:hypothetical protein
MDLIVRASGFPEMARRLQGTARAIRDAAATALRTEHELVMTTAKSLTPVDTGALRASGHVNETLDAGGVLRSAGGFGGPALDYAVYVHEDLTALHRVGQAKFYEIPLVEATRGMAERLAATIRAQAGRASG